MRCDPDLVNTIRHDHTNYDKLSVYYHVWRKYRSRLNRTICMLILEQIDIPEFRERVAHLEQQVDLTRPRNQKRYLKERRDAMMATGRYKFEAANKQAKANLQSVLQFQKAVDTGNKRYDLFDNFLTKSYYKGKKC